VIISFALHLLHPSRLYATLHALARAAKVRVEAGRRLQVAASWGVGAHIERPGGCCRGFCVWRRGWRAALTAGRAMRGAELGRPQVVAPGLLMVCGLLLAWHLRGQLAASKCLGARNPTSDNI
jgi:hypothetical protein